MTFPDFCRQCGIIPPESIPFDEKVRCRTESHPRKKNGIIRLSKDGKVGWAWDCANMSERAEWRALNSQAPQERSAVENAGLSAKLAEVREKGREASREAYEYWQASRPFIGAAHPYLERKRATMLGCKGLKVGSDGELLIPVMLGSRIISVQRIYPDGSKKHWPGAPIKWGCYWLWRKDAPITILAEGFATALTLFEALPNAKVCVCFSAGSMVPLAEHLDWHGMTAIAGDNDHAKPCPWCLKNGEHLQNPPNAPRPEQCRCNAGWTAALAAAKIIGCGVAIPPTQEGTTDFNDWFVSLLGKKEEANEFIKWKPSPFSLRKEACAPISSAIMSACRMVYKNLP